MYGVRDMVYSDIDTLLYNSPSIDSETYELEDKIHHLEARVAKLEKCLDRLIKINLNNMTLCSDMLMMCLESRETRDVEKPGISL